MKWIALALGVLLVVPTLGQLMRSRPSLRRWVVMCIAFDLFNPLHINLISDEHYRGDSRGIEVTSVDLLALALAVSYRGVPRRTAPATRYTLARSGYFLAFLLSLSATPDLLRSMFSVWKLVRMNGVFLVMLRAMEDLELVAAALDGLALGVVTQGGLSLIQKYVHHAIRVQGTQSHPNSLAMIVNMVSPVAFSLLLSGRSKRLAPWVVAFAGVCDIMSLSRGGMMMFALGITIVLGVSMIRRPTPRTFKIMLVLVLGATIVLAKSLDTIVERFTEAPKESELARKKFNKAAHAMAEEHSLGVGINMYSYVLDHAHYADRFQIEPGDRSGVAHHVYWLTAAELGYGGLVAYGTLLFAVWISAVACARRPGIRGDIGLGIATALTTMYLQGTAEWIARQTTMSYCFWLFAAMTAGLRGAPVAAGQR